jgi:hypothetical protein
MTDDKKPLPWFEIVGFDGKVLELYKKDGTTWKYPLREGEVPALTLLELVTRQNDNWGILGVATFRPISSKILILEKIGLG